MSYCVNCGVELAEPMAACPLCHTPVVHPGKADTAPGIASYPPHVERVYRNIDRRYGALLALIALCIPVICSIIIDILVVDGIRYSLYATGGALCIFICVIFPLLLKRPNPYLHILYDTAIIALYLAGILFVVQDIDAYLRLALPLCGVCSAIAFAITPVLRAERLHDSLYKPAIIIFIVSASCIVIELIVDLYNNGAFYPIWSLIAACSGTVTALMLVLIEGKQQLKEKIRRRLLV